MNLAEFVQARLDEDEAAAKAPAWPPGGLAVLDDIERSAWYPLTPPQASHIARHDPARVLREVAAKRAIIAIHGFHTNAPHGSQGEQRCAVCITDQDPYPELWEGDFWPCLTLRRLADIWSTHPDYQPVWKP